MADGALRSDVFRALRDAEVEIEDLPDGRFRLFKGDSLEIVRLGEVVSRTKVDELSRIFIVAKVKFFPPLTGA